MTKWARNYLENSANDTELFYKEFISKLREAANMSMPKIKQSRTDHKDAWYYCERVKELNATQCQRKGRTEQSIHPNTQEEADNIARNFTERTKSHNLPQTTWEKINEISPARWRKINTACNMPDDTDTPFTMEELNSALSKGKRETAPGADAITYSMLRHMGNPAKQIYLLLVNRTYAEHTRPKKWQQQDTQPIPKPKEPGAYRPMSLISCTQEVAERIVLNRLLWKVGPLYQRLYAYREVVGTHECLTDVLCAINGRKSIVVFLDLVKVYELANAATILSSLVRKRIKGNLLTWTKGYMQDRGYIKTEKQE
ncbi:uncharacterized protein LOC135195375 [Macrobrachium nipponense]|uniref:uncharacterized protein LOC135195375 n=1 Tax=Macrobrachium nipponense TaxID=159736 RepID=UPI0030C81DEF